MGLGGLGSGQGDAVPFSRSNEGTAGAPLPVEEDDRIVRPHPQHGVKMVRRFPAERQRVGKQILSRDKATVHERRVR